MKDIFALSRYFGVSRAKPVASDLVLGEMRLDRNAMARARRLAKKLGVVIESDRDSYYWVSCPSVPEDIDPIAGNRYRLGGREVLEAVEAYAEYLKSQE